ncbi:unnamed protein product [Protopolystoma xenopodis]|uniref:Peptidase M1 membrane alanine aminopeptidase domain-containing protein n=1 Tax=Protopolystoma xenopodis TaxID=117903 RepID=A0A448XDL8_9PLAT|nr:unnamed protein product [Protopolystoma xenopodis]
MSVPHNGVNLRVVWRRGYPSSTKDLGRFSLEVAQKALSFYNDYFAIPYSLPKLDFLAVPDFAGGAMENWGLITFRLVICFAKYFLSLPVFTFSLM